MTTRTFWLPGWGMFPERAPERDFDGIELEKIDPWPGYTGWDKGQHEKLWNTAALVKWLHNQFEYRAPGEPIALTGWSMGGLLALCYADRYPDRVRHVSLWASTACFLEKEEWPGQPLNEVLALKQSIDNRDKKGFERFMRSQIPVDPAYRALRRAWLSSIRLPAWEGLSHSLQWLIDTDLRKLLAAIHLPVAVHHGSEDCIIPYTAGEKLAQHLAQSTWHLHSSKGHAIWL